MQLLTRKSLLGLNKNLSLISARARPGPDCCLIFMRPNNPGETPGLARVQLQLKPL